jgi:hypothetical protein
VTTEQHDEELKLYSTLNNVRTINKEIKNSNLGGSCTMLGEYSENIQNFRSEILKERDTLGDINVIWGLLLKPILRN